jgi:hypothetical protein
MIDRATRVAFVACIGLIVGSAVHAGKDDKASIERSEQWEMAATDRELAATTQERQADKLLAAAQESRKKEYLYDTERKVNLSKAGEAERMAGDLEVTAYMNYDKAQANWSAAAEEYRRLRDPEKEKRMRARVETARINALQACAKACEAFEEAADAFGKDNADDAVRASQSSEKAAQHREILAGRQ